MARREWQIAVASAVAWAGMARGQAPAFIPAGTPAAAATEGAAGSVVTLHTAGQPDRRLQILKTERMPDGKIVTEVRDLATGAVFIIADIKTLAGAEIAKPTAAAPVPKAPAPPLPGTIVPSTYLPLAKPRTADPLLGGATVPPPPAPKPEYPTLMSRLTGSTQTPTTATTTTTTTTPPPPPPLKQSAISAALFGSNETPPQPTPTLLGKINDKQPAAISVNTGTGQVATPTATAQTPSTTGGLKAAVFGSPTAQPQETPTLMGKLFGEKAAPQPAVPTPVQAVKVPTQNVIRPNSVSQTSLVVAERPAPMPPAMAMPPAPVAVMPPPRPVIQQAEMVALVPRSSDSRDPNFNVVPAKAMTMKQIEEQVKDLRMHDRPSMRVEAANALASGPMAGMVEVRQVLAEASYRDPEPVVRAHCIDILHKMNYDEPNYRKYVESLVNDDEPAVQRAARAAVR